MIQSQVLLCHMFCCSGRSLGVFHSYAHKNEQDTKHFTNDRGCDSPDLFGTGIIAADVWQLSCGETASPHHPLCIRMLVI